MQTNCIQIKGSILKVICTIGTYNIITDFNKMVKFDHQINILYE